MEDAPLPTRIGPYRVLHRLGSGGMASVYAAEHETQGQRVALKLLSPEAALDPSLLTRFRDEAETLIRLQIPGVVRGLGSGRHGQTAYLVMEWLHGQSLREWMDRHPGPIALEHVLSLGSRLADILARVHAEGITHRDLKPENLFLCSPGDGPLGPRLRLLDFGIAKQPPRVVDSLDPTQVHTQESALMGSYPYMAPEQFRSASLVGPRADVYSLGILLFELLAGRRPFVAEDPVELISEHARLPPPSPREFVPSLPRSPCVLLESMLAKMPSERPSMRECHEVLGRPWAPVPENRLVPGLAPFTPAEAELFFGRDEELQALRALLGELHPGPTRWLQLEGPSGVGKSSLLHAGLLPGLGPGWLVVGVRPRDEPLRALARALAASPLGAGETAEALERTLQSGTGALRELAAARTPEGQRLLLVLEPLEELFTLGADACAGMDGLLSAALDDAASPLRLLTCVRADFLHRLEQVPLLAARHLAHAARFPLLPMRREALVQVVDGMAHQASLRLEEGLAARLASDARGEAGGLALLGHALHALWMSSEGVCLTHATYERLGGVGGALAHRAEALLDGLGARGRERARGMLLGLVQPGRGVPDTRRSRSWRELLAAGGGDALAEQVLRRLSGLATEAAGDAEGLRLLQLSEGMGAGEERVDLVHELLLQRVGSLARWIEEERTGLERSAALEAMAHEWLRADSPVEGLPTGSLLAHYRGGEGRGPGAVGRRESPEVTRFLDAALSLERRRARTRGVLAGVGVLAVLLILLSSARAEQERERAEEALGRAEASLKQFLAQMNAFAGGSDWMLSWLPYTRQVREQMLTDFRLSLDALAPSQRQDPEVRQVAVKLIHRQADFAYQSGTLGEARERLAEAEEELLAATFARPGEGEVVKLWAFQESKWGKVARARGLFSQACEHFTRAVELFGVLPATADGDVKDDQRSLAESRFELAGCEMDFQQWDKARDQLDAAIELTRNEPRDWREGIVRWSREDQSSKVGAPEDAAYDDALLAEKYLWRGRVLLQTHQSERARVDFDEARRLSWRSVLQAREGDQYSRWMLAQVLLTEAAVQSRDRWAQDARVAREMAERLLEGDPQTKRYALVLLEALARQAALTRTPEASPLRTERCVRARGFRAEDPEDIRFVLEDCPQERRPQGETP